MRFAQSVRKGRIAAVQTLVMKVQFYHQRQGSDRPDLQTSSIFLALAKGIAPLPRPDYAITARTRSTATLGHEVDIDASTELSKMLSDFLLWEPSVPHRQVRTVWTPTML
jgi:hypothetical protein